MFGKSLIAVAASLMTFSAFTATLGVMNAGIAAVQAA